MNKGLIEGIENIVKVWRVKEIQKKKSCWKKGGGGIIYQIINLHISAINLFFLEKKKEKIDRHWSDKHWFLFEFLRKEW